MMSVDGRRSAPLPAPQLNYSNRSVPRRSGDESATSIWGQETEFGRTRARIGTGGVITSSVIADNPKGIYMSLQDDNKAIVGQWFDRFWGKTFDASVIEQIAAPDMLLKYSLHEPRRGRADIKNFITDFRAAFRDLNFWGTADLLAEGDYVIGQWEGGGTHTGPAFKDFLAGSLSANTGKTMRFTGVTILKLKDGKIVEEIGLDDGVACLTQLGILKAA